MFCIWYSRERSVWLRAYMLCFSTVAMVVLVFVPMPMPTPVLVLVGRFSSSLTHQEAKLRSMVWQ